MSLSFCRSLAQVYDIPDVNINLMQSVFLVLENGWCSDFYWGRHSFLQRFKQLFFKIQSCSVRGEIMHYLQITAEQMKSQLCSLWWRPGEGGGEWFRTWWWWWGGLSRALYLISETSGGGKQMGQEFHRSKHWSPGSTRTHWASFSSTGKNQ